MNIIYVFQISLFLSFEFQFNLNPTMITGYPKVDNFRILNKIDTICYPLIN